MIDYRGGVGPAKLYDVIGAQQFCVMIGLGLRAHHKMLDLGCGSLRGGRLFIPYLDPGNYYGIEPDTDLIVAGFENELGKAIIKIKKPTFWCFDDFTLTDTGHKFNYILAQSILSHTGRDKLAYIFRQVSASLDTGGVFAATFFPGSDSNKSGWLGHGITSYSVETMSRLARSSGMGFELLPRQHPVGQEWFVAKKVAK